MPGTRAFNYTDENEISTWARNGINYVTSIGVMKGVEDNKFLPKGKYTNEQAYITMLRMHELN